MKRLSTLGESVLLEMFNRERSFEDMERAHNHGATTHPRKLPDTMYRRFVTELANEDGLGRSFEEFPVLARHVTTAVTFWKSSLLELFARIEQDRELLESVFSVNRTAFLADLNLDLSDPHRGGRTVAVLHFTDRADATDVCKVVYKPKDMRMDAAFQRVLDQVPSLPDLSPPRSIKVLARDGYGYMEFVDRRPCRDEAELRRFYRSAGRMTAILYALGCSDCHHENLVAHGDQLILIDAETLFEPTLRDLVNDAMATPQSKSAIQQRVFNSVTRSGMLPKWEYLGDGLGSIDTSALGVEPPTNLFIETPGWIGVNTDGMIAGLVMAASEMPASTPYSYGDRNRFKDFIDPFCAAFEDTLVGLIRARDIWTEPDGLLDSFRGIPRRLVVRPTRVYARILSALRQADALRSEVAQGLVLERLALAYLPAHRRPENWDVFKSEVVEMSALDIPAFWHAVESTELPLAHDLPTVRQLIEVSGLESSRRRIQQLDPNDLALQDRIIRGVVDARWVQLDERLTFSRAGQETTGAIPALGAIADSTCAINSQTWRHSEAERLASLLLRDAIAAENGHLDWLGLSLGADGVRMDYGLLGPTLYSGTAGLGLFFAALGPNHKHHALRCIGETLELALESSEARRRRWWRDQPLGLNGCGGTLLALEALSELDPSHSDRYQGAINRLLQALHPDRFDADREYDIIGGSAGLVGALLRHGTRESMQLAECAARHLLDNQNERGAWAQPNGVLYSGFAHGSAGICAALAAVGRATGDVRFFQAIPAAIAHERTCFLEAAGNWLRHPEDTHQPKNSWCHGAPGIALARICLLRNPILLSEVGEDVTSIVRRDLDLALATCSSYRPAAPLDHLCCGAFGRAAILRIAGRSTESDQIERRAYEDAMSNGGLYAFGHAVRADTPSLFRGRAGIGLALLDSKVMPTVISAGLYS